MSDGDSSYQEHIEKTKIQRNKNQEVNDVKMKIYRAKDAIEREITRDKFVKSHKEEGEKRDDRAKSKTKAQIDRAVERRRQVSERDDRAKPPTSARIDRAMKRFRHIPERDDRAKSKTKARINRALERFRHIPERDDRAKTPINAKVDRAVEGRRQIPDRDDRVKPSMDAQVDRAVKGSRRIPGEDRVKPPKTHVDNDMGKKDQPEMSLWTNSNFKPNDSIDQLRERILEPINYVGREDDENKFLSMEKDDAESIDINKSSNSTGIEQEKAQNIEHPASRHNDNKQYSLTNENNLLLRLFGIRPDSLTNFPRQDRISRALDDLVSTSRATAGDPRLCLSTNNEVTLDESGWHFRLNDNDYSLSANSKFNKTTRQLETSIEYLDVDGNSFSGKHSVLEGTKEWDNKSVLMPDLTKRNETKALNINDLRMARTEAKFFLYESKPSPARANIEKWKKALDEELVERGAHDILFEKNLPEYLQNMKRELQKHINNKLESYNKALPENARKEVTILDLYGNIYGGGYEIRAKMRIVNPTITLSGLWERTVEKKDVSIGIFVPILNRWQSGDEIEQSFLQLDDLIDIPKFAFGIGKIGKNLLKKLFAKDTAKDLAEPLIRKEFSHEVAKDIGEIVDGRLAKSEMSDGVERISQIHQPHIRDLEPGSPSMDRGIAQPRVREVPEPHPIEPEPGPSKSLDLETAPPPVREVPEPHHVDLPESTESVSLAGKKPTSGRELPKMKPEPPMLKTETAPPKGTEVMIKKLPPGPKPPSEPMFIKEEPLPEGTNKIVRRPNIRTAAKKPSEMLGINLKGKGDHPPSGDGFEAHHIIPEKEGPDWLRDRLRDAGIWDEININSPENGVWLPKTREIANEYGREIHIQGLHSDKSKPYIKALTGRLKNLHGDAFLSELSKIKKELMEGRFKF